MVEMRILDGEKFAHEKLLNVAASCIHAMHKAPQITGRVKIKTMVLTGKILEFMFEAQAILGRVAIFNILSGASWQRAYYADEPPVLLLIGAQNIARSELNWDCGACGFKTCREMNKYHNKDIQRSAIAEIMMHGPVCMWKLFDFGLVCDWACAACWQENVTNRIIELNRCYPTGVFDTRGNYSVFLEKKDEALRGQERYEETLANRVRREVEWLKRGPKARTRKSGARIQDAARLQGELATVTSRLAT